MLTDSDGYCQKSLFYEEPHAWYFDITFSIVLHLINVNSKLFWRNARQTSVYFRWIHFKRRFVHVFLTFPSFSFNFSRIWFGCVLSKVSIKFKLCFFGIFNSFCNIYLTSAYTVCAFSFCHNSNFVVLTFLSKQI